MGERAARLPPTPPRTPPPAPALQPAAEPARARGWPPLVLLLPLQASCTPVIAVFCCYSYYSCCCWWCWWCSSHWSRCAGGWAVQPSEQPSCAFAFRGPRALLALPSPPAHPAPPSAHPRQHGGRHSPPSGRRGGPNQRALHHQAGRRVQGAGCAHREWKSGGAAPGTRACMAAQHPATLPRRRPCLPTSPAWACRKSSMACWGWVSGQGGARLQGGSSARRPRLPPTRRNGAPPPTPRRPPPPR